MYEAAPYALSAALLLLHLLQLRSAARERNRLVNAVLARTPAEFLGLQKATDPQAARKSRDDDDDVRVVVPHGL